ncbi:Crp/Fnr family transcriptional regulator [Sulfuricystis thermophila]|uniref:Crp/Fnr family transcriptional regulator n=1 Tax=Sulfuricystis thermophila TaxID=2496847 RepID=UPI001035E271|nr:Crp/Fnr family transcriptional regulator [Sulfuricystis thermophila]
MSSQELRGIPFFAELPAALLTELSAATRERRYEKDELIVIKGDRPTGMYAVLSGVVKLACQSPAGEERVIDLVGSGEVFGVSTVLLGNAYPYLAAALSPTRLLHIDAEAVLTLSGRSAQFAKRLLVKLSTRLYARMRDLEDFRLHPPVKRLASYLLNAGAASCGNGTVISFCAPKHVIASRLGMTPEALSRCLRELSDSGAISVGTDHVRVLDAGQLRVMSERR